MRKKDVLCKSCVRMTKTKKQVSNRVEGSFVRYYVTYAQQKNVKKLAEQTQFANFQHQRLTGKGNKLNVEEGIESQDHEL